MSELRDQQRPEQEVGARLLEVVAPEAEGRASIDIREENQSGQNQDQRFRDDGQESRKGPGFHCAKLLEPPHQN
jgi:hypothetical protein